MFKIFIGLSIVLFLSLQNVSAQLETHQCKRILDAVDEGHESISIDGTCLWRKVDRIEGTKVWEHPSRWLIDSFSTINGEVIATKPLTLYFSDNGNKLTFGIFLYTNESMANDTEVKIWYTGLDKGVTFFEGEFINLDRLSAVFATLDDRMISLLNELAEADEAIIRYRLRDIILTKDMKITIKEMVNVWENHRHKLK